MASRPYGAVATGGCHGVFEWSTGSSSGYGQTLEDLARFLRAGVDVGLGADVSPHNLLEEMQWAGVLARIAGEAVRAVGLADVFHAAMVGGATAMGRRDLGRLAPEMKADLVLVDPLLSLVYTAAERAVRDVYVDGIRVVTNRQVLTLNRVRAGGSVEVHVHVALVSGPAPDAPRPALQRAVRVSAGV